MCVAAQRFVLANKFTLIRWKLNKSSNLLGNFSEFAIPVKESIY